MKLTCANSKTRQCHILRNGLGKLWVSTLLRGAIIKPYILSQFYWAVNMIDLSNVTILFVTTLQTFGCNTAGITVMILRWVSWKYLCWKIFEYLYCKIFEYIWLKPLKNTVLKCNLSSPLMQSVFNRGSMPPEVYTLADRIIWSDGFICGKNQNRDTLLLVIACLKIFQCEEKIKKSKPQENSSLNFGD